VRGRYALASNKHCRMFSATTDLLRKAPTKLTGVSGPTGAYSVEALLLRGEHRFRYVARGVSLVVACLMCLGVFVVPLRVTGSEVPSALAMANLPLPDLETNENAPLLDGIYVVALGEEAEDGDKDPLNSKLLRMLLLTLCFGLSVRWLLRNAQKQGALCFLAFVGASFATACEDPPSLGVFRL
jgi:hypothetical protein